MLFASNVVEFFSLLGLTRYCKKAVKKKAELESDPTTLDSNLAKLEKKYKVKLLDKKCSTKFINEDKTNTTVPKVDLSELEEEAKPIKVLVRTTNSTDTNANGIIRMSWIPKLIFLGMSISGLTSLDA